ncbi:hypothetical protein LCGC14_2552720 [marine sediment metagenome]|uniref:Uncharacterized protein n=1 Tax=marine sediment metagenome TaxID=412755 RepID=A0A0F9BAD1_9ZZZZ
MSTDSPAGQSIEAAWKELGIACWWRSRAPDSDEGVDFIANEQAAARACMLAVLDEAFKQKHWHTLYCMDEDVWCPRDRIAADIAALGKGKP